MSCVLNNDTKSGTKYFVVAFLMGMILMFAPPFSRSAAAAARDILEGGKQFELQHYENAIKILEPLSNQENYFAKGMMAIIYGRGLSKPQNTAKSEKLIKPVLPLIVNHAKKGDVLAQYLLGKLYLNGVGVPLLPKKGVEWMTKSAKLGNKLAQFRLGAMYETGNLVTKDKTMAIKWYKMAATNGFTEGNQRIKEMQTAKSPKTQKDNPLLAKKVGSLNPIAISPLPKQLPKQLSEKSKIPAPTANADDKAKADAQDENQAVLDLDADLLADALSTDMSVDNLQILQLNQTADRNSMGNFKNKSAKNAKGMTESAICYEIAIDVMNSQNQTLPNGMRDYSNIVYSKLKANSFDSYNQDTAMRVLSALKSSISANDNYYAYIFPIMKSFCSYSVVP